MKKILIYIIFAILCSTSIYAQRLTLTDLTTLCSKKNWEEVNRFLNSRGWEFHSSERGSATTYSRITWMFNRNNDIANFLFFTSEGFPNRVSYRVRNQESYNLINNAITGAGFRSTGSRIDDGKIVSTYRSANYTLEVSSQRQQNATIYFFDLAEVACNKNTPGWGNNLGTISFASNRTWKIGNQTWSDAVQATNCNKTAFNGGEYGKLSRRHMVAHGNIPWNEIPFFNAPPPNNFNADCRSNPDQKGDLFSWCAVARFWRQLCPDGWRVPTTRDFILLDEYFGGDGDRRRDSEALITKYTEWGGVRGGACEPNGTLVDQGVGAFYWAISTVRPGKGNRLNFFTDGYVSPQGWDNKNLGHTLRCVR
jgi:uncharacterized protein (TIGR02145 family)